MDLFGKEPRPRLETIDCDHIIDKYAMILTEHMDISKRDAKYSLYHFKDSSEFNDHELSVPDVLRAFEYIVDSKCSEYIYSILDSFENDINELFEFKISYWIKTNNIVPLYSIGDKINGKEITQMYDKNATYILNGYLVHGYEV